MIDSPSGRVPKRPPDGIAEEQKLAAAGTVFWVALCWFPDFREFIEVELGQTEPRGAHKESGHAYPPRHALLPCRLLICLLVPPKAPRVSLVQKKINKKFRSVRTSFGTDFLENQKQANNNN